MKSELSLEGLLIMISYRVVNLCDAKPRENVKEKGIKEALKNRKYSAYFVWGHPRDKF